MKTNKFVKTQPVARFFYKGSHSHPVKRTVVIVESSPKMITGYELREGRDVRDFKNAPIKNYRKDKVAKIKEIDKRRVMRREAKKSQLLNTTMIRQGLNDLIQNGA